MKNSTLLGSAASVLLAFSVISYARTDIPQDPKPTQKPIETPSSQSNTALAPETLAENETISKPVADAKGPVKLTETFTVPALTYTATAYSLRGRTASGKPVARGLIAADPRLLPLGTRVRIEAGPFSGEYLVADTGGAVKGRRIDIWTPSTREAMQFGRRPVKLTVLELGGRRAKNPATRLRVVTPSLDKAIVTVQPATPKN